MGGPINRDTVEGRKSMQRALNYAVWYIQDRHMPITGVIDPETRRGIREFQRIWEHEITGLITDAEIIELENEMVRKNITDY